MDDLEEGPCKVEIVGERRLGVRQTRMIAGNSCPWQLHYYHACILLKGGSRRLRKVLEPRRDVCWKYRQTVEPYYELMFNAVRRVNHYGGFKERCTVPESARGARPELKRPSLREIPSQTTHTTRKNREDKEAGRFHRHWLSICIHDEGRPCKRSRPVIDGTAVFIHNDGDGAYSFFVKQIKKAGLILRDQ
jgi:hypothetical protein